MIIEVSNPARRLKLEIVCQPGGFMASNQIENMSILLQP